MSKPSGAFAEPAPVQSRASRKSEVVRNVEKLEHDRRDRRDQAKNLRYKRDQQRAKHDVDDKQWEFAQM